MINLNQIDHLRQWINKFVESVPHSRIHRIKTFSEGRTVCYIKRDDELSFGVSGSKLRKYLSLLSFLKTNSIEEALLIGDPYSNHLLSFTQLLIENDIKPRLFLLKKRASYPLCGNFLFLSLFVPENQIQWVSETSDVEEIARKYALQNNEKKTIIIPQGAYMVEALPGAFTLPLDIIANEEQIGSNFAHVFIEAGTGLSAISLSLAFAWLNKKTKIHVLLLADTKEQFFQKLEEFRNTFNHLISGNLSQSQVQKQFQLHLPLTAASFGSTNKTVFKEIISIARKEGFLIDPIYGAKLLATSRYVLKKNQLKGPILLIHSGGGLTLSGFEKQLQHALKESFK